MGRVLTRDGSASDLVKVAVEALREALVTAGLGYVAAPSGDVLHNRT